MFHLNRVVSLSCRAIMATVTLTVLAGVSSSVQAQSLTPQVPLTPSGKVFTQQQAQPAQRLTRQRIEAARARLQERAYPFKAISASAYMSAAAHRARMPKVTSETRSSGLRLRAAAAIPATGNRWQSIGPNGIAPNIRPNELQAGFRYRAGRVNALAFDPVVPSGDANRAIVYAATSSGGVWKSTDNAATWRPLTDRLPFLQTSSVAVTPGNSNVIYAGTGDFDQPLQPANGFGLLRSTNGGETWTILAGSGLTSLTGLAISAIVVDPDQTNRVTFATGRGDNPDGGFLFTSTDQGTTLRRVTIQNSGGWNGQGQWGDLKITRFPINGVRHYFATCVDATNPARSGLYRSINRGLTWQRIEIGTGFLPNGANSRFDQFGAQMEVAPSATDANVVYVVFADTFAEAGSQAHVLRLRRNTTTDTYTVEDITGSLADADPAIWSQSFYCLHLNCGVHRISGRDIDALYLGNTGLYVNLIGLADWRTLSENLPSDQHAFAFHPTVNTTMLAGNDSGICRLEYVVNQNRWAFNSLPSRFLNITEFNSADVVGATATPRILGGAQDVGTVFSNANTSFWYNVGFLDSGGGVAIHPIESSTQYTSSTFLSSILYTNAFWANTQEIVPTDDEWNSQNLPVVGQLTIDPTDPRSLFVGTNHLWRFDSYDQFWEPSLGSTSLSDAGTIRTIAPRLGQEVAETSTLRRLFGTIYAGTTDGRLWRGDSLAIRGRNNRTAALTDVVWFELNEGLTTLPNRAITGISPNPNNVNDILITVSGFGSGHIFRCPNTQLDPTTIEFTDLSGTGDTGLPDIPVNCLARSTSAPTQTFYVGTDLGVFRTQDGGTTWEDMTESLGLPNVPVQSLKVAGTYLYAATYGRGIWRVSLNEADSAPRNPNLGNAGVTSFRTENRINVTARISNTNGAAANTVRVTAVTLKLVSNNRVLPLTTRLPVSVGNITAGGQGTFTLTFFGTPTEVPSGTRATLTYAGTYVSALTNKPVAFSVPAFEITLP